MAKRCLKLTRRLEKISRNKGWWIFELAKTEVKKMCWYFLSSEEKKVKKKKKCWFNSQKQNCAVLCFCLKNTQIWYHLLRRSCKKTQSYFLASKNTFFFSEQKTEQFVWYYTDFSVHFCNFFLVGLYQLASVLFLIITFDRFQSQPYHFLSYQNENY